MNLNRPEHPDDLLLEEARMAAESDREEEFVADLLKDRDKYGASFRITAKQRQWLERIAHGDTTDRFGFNQ